MFELAIYSWKRCKRLVLNEENKGKEQICLSRTEYKIHEDGTILVKKKRLIEILLNTGAATIRVGATIILCSLAAIGLISLLYVGPRTELLIIMQEVVEQLHSMLGV